MLKIISIINKVILSKKIIIVLLLVGLVSYGQLVAMNFWQDDNAVIFKFTHINEEAGYLGKGILGDGPYRYTLTPYYPIYKLFGYNSVPYFTLALIFYLGSVLAVYFFFLDIFKEKIKTAMGGLLYGAGYIASDGFIRLFNSVLTSLTITLVCFTIAAYKRLLDSGKLIWYFAGLAGYFLAVQIGYIRTHYLILIIVGMEAIWLFPLEKALFKKCIKHYGYVFLRLIPFLYIFYKEYLADVDARSIQVKVFILSLLHGQLYNTYSFFSSLGNIVLPNEVYYNHIFSLISRVIPSLMTESKAIFFLVLLGFLLSCYLWKVKLLSGRNAFLSSVIFVVVLTLSKGMFNYSGLIGGLNEKLSLYTGIFSFVSLIVLFIVLPYKKISGLFILWLCSNLIAYAAYLPDYSYPSDNRYLLHTFVAFIGLVSIYLYIFWQKRFVTKFSYVFIASILLWGIFNLYSGVVSEHNIILNRADPSRVFFNQLKSDYPTMEKGSVLYFYIPDEPHALDYYNAAISTAQMPDETSIAWRYGIDRYDLSLVNSFSDLKNKIISQNTPIDKVFAFIADPENLINVTDQTRKLLRSGNNSTQIVNSEFNDVYTKGEKGGNFEFTPIIITPPSVSALMPIDLSIILRPAALNMNGLSFPLVNKTSNGKTTTPGALRRYILYKEWLDSYYKEATISATASWKNFTPNLLLDKDPSTYWEADRVVWDKPGQSLNVDLGKIVNVGDLIYQNGPDSLTPTDFEIQTSTDNSIFTNEKEVFVDISKKHDLQIIPIGPVDARFIRLIFKQTQYGDAPGISELQILPSSLSTIDVNSANQFINSPFDSVDSLTTWNILMDNFADNASIKLSWEKDNFSSWETGVQSIVPIAYNDEEQIIHVEIPSGGQKLKAIKIEPLTIPGSIFISQITYQNIPIQK